MFVRDVCANVTDEELLRAFSSAGAVVDARMCGDPHAALRFAFVEYENEEAVARVCPSRSFLFFPRSRPSKAVALTGTVLGGYAVRVVRSKTAIVPVNSSLLPRTEQQMERCRRTVYVTGIDLDAQACSAPAHLCTSL